MFCFCLFNERLWFNKKKMPIFFCKKNKKTMSICLASSFPWKSEKLFYFFIASGKNHVRKVPAHDDKRFVHIIFSIEWWTSTLPLEWGNASSKEEKKNPLNEVFWEYLEGTNMRGTLSKFSNIWVDWQYTPHHVEPPWKFAYFHESSIFPSYEEILG